MRILDTKDLAELLRLSVGTIHQYASKSPEKLPPRLHVPGRRLQWAEEDVEDWLRSHKAVPEQQ